MQHLFHNSQGKEEWRCKWCRQNYQLSGGNHAIKRHLNEYHQIFEDSSADTRAKNIQINIENAMTAAAAYPQKRRKLNDSDGGTLPLDGDVIEVLYVKFIVACNIPLRLVECPEVRAFISYLNKDVDRWLNTSHHTIREWVMRQFKNEKAVAKIRLQKARSKIHISLDIWTSTNNKGIMGITAVYIEEEGQLDHTVLAVKEIEGNHQGENLAPLVMEVIKDWEIAEKLGYFVMDNASNNDTMMRWISKGKLANSVYFDSILLKTLEMLHEYGIQYDSQHHRLRCQGHVLNLSVNSFLYVTDSDYLEEDDDVPGQLKQSLKDIKKWRKFGPIGKLHNIVVDIQSSAIRMQEFLILSRGTRPVRDNKTRWNSMEAMIKRSITSPVFEAIRKYVQRHITEDLAKDELTDADWSVLRDIHEFLDRLLQTTLALESHNSTLDKVLPAMDFVLEQFEVFKEKHKYHPMLGPMFDSGWAKMDKYYTLTDESPAYLAAIILNPNFKWQYIQSNWKLDWLPRARTMMEEFWQSYKLQTSSISTPTLIPEPTQGLGQALASSSNNEFNIWMRRHQSVPNLDDEYARYCASDCTYDVDPRSWWLEKTQQASFPNLSKMALDILSIPAMSADPERLFSSAKLCLTDLRNKLGIDILEAFECLKSWYKIKAFREESKWREEIFGKEAQLLPN